MGKEGKTFAQMACELDVDMDTLTEWKSKHPEFSAAYKKSRLAQQALYEKIGLKMMLGRKDATMPSPNPTIWIFTMKARFGYKEEPEPEFEDQELDFV